MQLERQSNGKLIDLGTALAGGGEGQIYTVSQEPSLVAKIYHKPTSTYTDKLNLMVANPPNDPAAGQGRVSIAWPVDLLFIAGGTQQIAGFLMRRVTEVHPIHDFYNPKSRRQHSPFFNYLYLLRTARNLAAAVQSLHASGYVIGDVNESNILLAETALVTLVDTDSFQVRDSQKGVVHRCRVGKPEFTPPELQGKTFSDIDRTPQHDRFGLAVLIFQLLMEGTHPFSAIFQGQGEPPSTESRILAGHFPYGKKRVPYLPPPIAPPFELLPPTLRQLFVRCFEQGHNDPYARPNAQTWVSALDEAENALITCSLNHQHRYGNHLITCPWCERTARLRGRDPFPSDVVVQKPLAPPKPKLQPVAFSQPPIQQSQTSSIQSLLWAVFVLYKNKLLVGGAILLLGLIGYDYWQSNSLETRLSSQPSQLTVNPTNSEPVLSQPQEIPLINVSLANTLNGHSSAVDSVAISPDGKILASGSEDKTIKLWNISTRKLLLTLKGHSNTVTSVAFSPNGKTLASGSEDKTIKLWNVSTGQVFRTLNGHAHGVSSVAFSPNGQTLASSSTYDTSIKLWNVSTGEVLHTLNGHTHWVSSVAFSPNGQTLASSSYDNTIKLWDVSTGEVLHTLKGHSHWVSSVAFSPNGQTLASSSYDFTIKLWNVATGKEINTLYGHLDSVYSVAFSPNGKTLASNSNDTTIKLWNVATDEETRTLDVHLYPSCAIIFSPDGKTLASGSDNTIKLWNLSTGEEIPTLQ